MKGCVAVVGDVDGHAVAALIKDGVLEDFLVDPKEERDPPIGSIFRAKGGRLLKGMGGALLELPDGNQAYLRGAKGLKPGAPMLVQVTHKAEEGKAVPVTTRLLFKSRFAIMTPGAPGLNISRAITDEDTLIKLHDLASQLMEGVSEDMGLIMRSACATGSDDEIADDITRMSELAQAVLDDVAGAPELLVAGPDAHTLAWQEWAEAEQFEEGEEALAHFGVHEHIAALLSPKSPLKGQANAYIEPTRAFVSIDVNTGSDFSMASGTRANIALARDLPRILRTRGLGGQIILDLAPMAKKDRRQFEQALKAAFKSEGRDTVLAGFTPLGNFEIQKKRARVPVSEVLA